MTYKKRARTGYCDGKGYKKESNSSERIFEKREIREELIEIEQGDDFRYKHKKKAGKKTEEQRLRSDIHRNEKYIWSWEWRRSQNDVAHDYFSGWINGLKNEVRSYKAKLVEIMSKRKKNDKNTKKD